MRHYLVRKATIATITLALGAGAIAAVAASSAGGVINSARGHQTSHHK